MRADFAVFQDLDAIAAAFRLDAEHAAAAVPLLRLSRRSRGAIVAVLAAIVAARLFWLFLLGTLLLAFLT